MRFENIDNILKASDIVEYIESERIRSHANGENFRRVDGTAKKGKAMAVRAADFDESAAKWALNAIEKRMKMEKGKDTSDY